MSLTLLMPLFALSQSISGTIRQSKSTIPYAEIIARKGQYKQSAISDANGYFNLKLAEYGTYSMECIYDGKTIYQAQIDVNGNIKHDLLVTDGNEKQIEGVTVTVRKKLIERKADRLIFNLSNSIASQGMDGLQALDMTPQIKADENGGITMIGKSGVAVMVNEQMLNLSGPDLINYIRSIRSESIEKIEVITAPPAKYEAQGNSGLINIVLKKNQDLGWNGSLTSSLIQTTYTGIANSATVNYQNKKLRTSLKLRQNDTQKHSSENYRIVGLDGLNSSDDRRDFGQGRGLNFSSDYEINKKSSLGLVFDYGSGKSGMDITNTSDYFQNQNYTNTLRTYAEHRDKNRQATISAYYDLKFGKQNNKLSITGNYFSNTPTSNIDFTTVDNSDHDYVVRTPSRLDYKIYSGQADLTLPFEFAKTEAGIKFTNFDNNSDLKYQNFTGQDYITDPQKSDLFNYNEKNYAVYAGMERQLSEKWNAKVGLRYEYAIINGNSVSSGQRSENSYGKFFPTAYLSYKANENHTFNINYSKRINRPGFRALNPFRWYTNVNSYYSGNPTLNPSFSHNFELSYLYKGKLSVSTYFQRETNAFGQLVMLEGENKTSRFYNFFNKNSTGISLNYSDTFLNYWEASYAAYFSHMKTQVFATDAASRKGNSTSFDIRNSFSLKKDKSVQLIMNYWFRLPSSLGNTYSYFVGNFTAGLKLSLMNKDLMMNVYVSDIFRQAKSHGEIYYVDSMHYFNNYYDGRSLSVSLTYNIGKRKLREGRQLRFDEKNRAN
ncbi:UNVERIFIED_CONTAM: outer membrane receptor protein involved in Fe transport [Pseudacidovorax intermedius]|nr:outer membrane receptor protein involved in Fe transport [Pseudacidovorax intermedius]